MCGLMTLLHSGAGFFEKLAPVVEIGDQTFAWNCILR